MLAAGLGLACADKSRAPVVAGPAPDTFRVTFETTRGPFTVEAIRAWAPNGADRFYQLVGEHFFDDNRFFRVIPGFVAQFGLNDKKTVNERWDALKLPDDSVPNVHRTSAAPAARDPDIVA